MAASHHADRETFLANVRRSGLLGDEQLAEALARLPLTGRGRPVARALVAMGLLTRFQAAQILAGRTSGFFLGQYRILSHIGSGGMGRVFKAEHRTLSRLVAVKVLAPRLLKTARAQELFLREVRAAARLLHPNIVTAFDANQEGSRTYLVMEYVDGPNLAQLVRARGPLPVGLACEYARQVAEGLRYAHRKGMVHRDIKPANLLLHTEAFAAHAPELPGSAAVKISDFGLARLTGPRARGTDAGGADARRNVLMGTPDYVAPEQARDGNQADVRSDLYSLGCTFFFLLTGRPPFPGGNALEKIVRHTTEDVPAVERLRPEVAAPVAAIVRRLMAKRPEDRFPTPDELAAALAPFCRAAPLPALRPPSSPFLDALGTSAGGAAEAAAEDGSALGGTVAPDASATPLGTTRLPLPTRPAQSPPVPRRPWLRTALLAAAFAAGLVAAGVTGWLLRAH
jgi:serine/threonine-protein kinase